MRGVVRTELRRLTSRFGDLLDDSCRKLSAREMKGIVGFEPADAG